MCTVTISDIKTHRVRKTYEIRFASAFSVGDELKAKPKANAACLIDALTTFLATYAPLAPFNTTAAEM